MKKHILVLLLGCVVLAVVGCDRHDVKLASHRAVYSLELDDKSSRNRVVDARGIMMLGLNEACDAITTEQRYDIRLSFSNGDVDTTVINFLNWESKDGKEMNFLVRKRTADGDDPDLRGEVRRAGVGDAGEIIIDQPAGKVIALPKGTFFPSQHTAELIRAAMRGKTIVQNRLFDGGEAAEPYVVNAIIGAQRAAPKDEKDLLLDHPSWPMRLAYFPADERSETPQFEMDVDMLANGVARSMTLDYGDFVVKATLKRIEPVPLETCD